MDRLDQIRQELRAFVAEHDLAPEYRWIANAEADAWSRNPEHRSRVAREAADVGIALLLFFDRIGVDFLEAVGAKIQAEGVGGGRSGRRGVGRHRSLH